jgi:thiol-disulfide isomerase/thioredoxin
MNCPHCNAELPAGSAFCPQCGSQSAGNKPIFPPVSPDQQPKGEFLQLIRYACLFGTLFLVAGIAGLALFSTLLRDKDEPLPSGPPGEIKAGTDFNLYGKTIQNEDFDWESLRGKYVLVKFTATWCPACQKVIPDLLKAYEKYHDKGLEFVSVYIGEQEPDAAATVKNHVERKKLPWIILSESLTVKAGLPAQGDSFDVPYLPTMLLVDKEGKVMATGLFGETLSRELEKLFEE